MALNKSIYSSKGPSDVSFGLIFFHAKTPPHQVEILLLWAHGPTDTFQRPHRRTSGKFVDMFLVKKWISECFLAPKKNTFFFVKQVGFNTWVNMGSSIAYWKPVQKTLES